MPVGKESSDAPALREPATGPASGKVVIIGAGIAGLSCGCYLQMNGIQTEILEASLLPADYAPRGIAGRMCLTAACAG